MAKLSVTVPKGNSVTLLSRVAGVDGVDITQSSLAVGGLTWSLVRYDPENGNETIVDGATLTISSYIYNTLQTFTYPTGRTFSYNFKYVVNGTSLDESGKYTAKFVFVDSNNYQYIFDVDLDVRDVV